MNLINKEIQVIKSIADNMVLSASGVQTENTYFEDRRQVTEKYKDIIEYTFSTPVELQEKLNEMWKTMGKNNMQAFSVVCSVAAYKNENEEKDESVISPFVYEF